MVVKVNEDKRSDVLARKAAWQKDYDTQKAEYDTQRRNFRMAQNAVSEAVANEIKKTIGNVPKYLDIRAEEDFVGYRVTVYYAEHNVHAEDKALSWNYSVTLSEKGEIRKESSSWSGLQATTVEQLNDLKESVRILEILNNMDWERILKKAMQDSPKWDDYVKAKSPESKNWGNEIVLATLEDAVGQNVLIKGDGERGGKVWYRIVGETPKRFNVQSFSGYTVDRINNGIGGNYNTIADMVNASDYTYGISKDKLVGFVQDWKHPEEIETIEF